MVTTADRAGIAFILLITASFYGSIIVIPEIGAMAQLIPSLFAIAGGAVGTLWLRSAYRQAHVRDRTFWLLLCMGTLSYALVNVVYSLFILMQQLELYYKGPHIIGIFPKIWFLGALLLKIRRLHGLPANKVKPYTMNIIVFLSVTVTLAIHYSLKPVWDYTHSPLYAFAMLAYPIMLWIFILVVAYFFHLARTYMEGRTLHVLFAGFMMLAAGDIGAILPYLSGNLTVVRLFEPIWLLSMLLIAYAGRYVQLANTSDAPGMPQAGSVSAGTEPTKDPILSYASVVLLLGLQLLHSWSGISVLNVGLSITFVIVIVHQVMLMRSNRTLMQKYSHLAHYDALTGLKNRAKFRDESEDLLRAASAANAPLSLMLVDLDGFKTVNDTHGHHIGDELLQEAASRFREALQGADAIYRMGGDEFVVIVPGPADASVAAAQAIIDALGTPIVIDGSPIAVTPSIGISTFPADAASVELLLKQADTAMYQAKTSGKNRYRHYGEG